MDTVAVPRALSIRDYRRASRSIVPVIHRVGGLAVTPHVLHGNRYTVTHVATGCAIPLLDDLTLWQSIAIAEVIGAAFAWDAIDDIHFFRTMPPKHQEAMRGCIVALREMFEVE